MALCKEDADSQHGEPNSIVYDELYVPLTFEEQKIDRALFLLVASFIFWLVQYESK